MNVRRGQSPLNWFILSGVFGFIIVLLLVIVFIPEANTDLENIHPLVTTLYRMGGLWGMVAIFVLAAGFFALIGAWVLFRELAALRQPCPLSLPEQMLALTQALEFGTDDLVANRSGRVSPAQEVKMQQMRRQSLLWNVIGLFMFPAVIVFFIVVFALSPGGPSLWQGIQRDPTVAYVLAGVGCFFALIIGYGILATVLRMMGPNTKRVYRVRGRARLRIQRVWLYGIRTTMCQLRIGFRRFNITEQQAQGFWNGARYDLYYLKYSPTHILLSAEPLLEP